MDFIILSAMIESFEESNMIPVFKAKDRQGNEVIGKITTLKEGLCRMKTGVLDVPVLIDSVVLYDTIEQDIKLYDAKPETVEELLDECETSEIFIKSEKHNYEVKVNIVDYSTMTNRMKVSQMTRRGIKEVEFSMSEIDYIEVLENGMLRLVQKIQDKKSNRITEFINKIIKRGINKVEMVYFDKHRVICEFKNYNKVNNSIELYVGGELHGSLYLDVVSELNCIDNMLQVIF